MSLSQGDAVGGGVEAGVRMTCEPAQAPPFRPGVHHLLVQLAFLVLLRTSETREIRLMISAQGRETSTSIAHVCGF